MDQPPKFQGFPSPKSNFTPVPNLFFDVVLSELKEAELKVMAYVFRRTYGWQKEYDCISTSQFEHGIKTRQGKQLDYGTGLARSTIIETLKSLVKDGYVLRYIDGKGSRRRSYFFLNSETNRQIVQALECGQLSIEELLGRKFKPRLGRNSGPKPPTQLGAKSEPTKQSRKKEGQKKKDSPDAPKNLSDEGERFREQRLIQERRLESQSQPTHIGDILGKVDIHSTKTTSHTKII